MEKYKLILLFLAFLSGGIFGITVFLLSINKGNKKERGDTPLSM